jgi:hypothetical protein
MLINVHLNLLSDLRNFDLKLSSFTDLQSFLKEKGVYLHPQLLGDETLHTTSLSQLMTTGSGR